MDLSEGKRWMELEDLVQWRAWALAVLNFWILLVHW
jgi:hypothetical protein